MKLAIRNFHDEATLSTQLPPVDGFSIDNTKDTQRSRVWRSTDGTDQFVQGFYEDGLPRTASHFSMHRHRCHGGSIRSCFYSDPGCATLVYDTGESPIINVTPTDGLDWGLDPYGAGRIDPFLTDAPYWTWDLPDVEHLSFRHYFSGNTSLYGAAFWQACRFVLAPTFELAFTAQYGATINVVSQTDRNRSRGGSLRTNVGPTWRTMTLDIIRLPESERAAWLDLMNYLGTGRDFVISLFPGEGTRRERDHTMNCKYSSLDALERWHRSFLKKRIQIEEV